MSIRASIVGVTLLLATTQPMLAIAQSAGSEESDLPRLTVTDVADRMAHAVPIAIFDSNGRARYETGHVPGARWIAFDRVGAADLPADRAATVVFYCMNERCAASHMAARQARSLGYRNVFIMPAGIMGWIAAGQRLVVGPNPN